MKKILLRELNEIEDVIFMLSAVYGGIKERRGIDSKATFHKIDRADPLYWVDFAITALDHVKDLREKRGTDG